MHVNSHSLLRQVGLGERRSQFWSCRAGWRQNVAVWKDSRCFINGMNNEGVHYVEGRSSSWFSLMAATQPMGALATWLFLYAILQTVDQKLAPSWVHV